MKKSLVLGLILALILTAATPAPVSSWYSSPAYSGSSLVLYGPEWFAFGSTSFETQSNGFYVLDNDVFTTTYSGIVKLTGACVQGKSSNITLKAEVGGESILLADTLETTFTFFGVFPAGELVIEGYNHDKGRYDELRCTILLEKVL